MALKGGFRVESAALPDGQNVKMGFIRRAPRQFETTYLQGPEARRHGVPPGLQFWRHSAYADGSCLFHTLATSLDIADFHSRSNKERIKIGRRLRGVVRRLLTRKSWRTFWEERLKQDGIQHKLGLVPSVEDIAKKLDDYKVWADIYLISWVCRVLELGMLFFDQQDGGRLFCGATGETDAENLVMVCWVSRVHFENLCVFDPRTQVMHTALTKDSPVAKHIMHIYDNSQCPAATIAVV